MQVPQLAVRIPIGRRVDLGPIAMSLWWVHDTDTTKGRNSLLQSAGSSRVYVLRAILIKFETT